MEAVRLSVAFAITLVSVLAVCHVRAAAQEAGECVLSTTDESDELQYADDMNYENLLSFINRPHYVEEGDIVFNNVRVPISLVVRGLRLEKDPATGQYPTEHIEEDDLMAQVSSLYSDAACSNTSSESCNTQFCWKDEKPAHSNEQTRSITFERFLEVMRDPEYVENGDILYNNCHVPIKLVNNVLPSSIGNLTEEKFLAITENIFTDHCQSSSTETTQHRENDVSGGSPESIVDCNEGAQQARTVTFERLLEIVEDPTYSEYGDILYNNDHIPIKLIASCLAGGFGNATEEEFMAKIEDIYNGMACGGDGAEEEAVGSPENTAQTNEESRLADEAAFKRFSEIVNDEEYLENGYVIFNDVKIPMKLLVKSLQLVKDPATGQYDTGSMTRDGWIATIVKLHDDIEYNSVGLACVEDEEAVHSLEDIVENSDGVQEAVLLYKGLSIPVPSVLNYLGAHADLATGRYDVSRYSDDEKRDSIYRMYLKIRDSKAIEEGVKDTEEFEKFLEVINNPRYIQGGNINYGERQMPISLLVTRLGLEKDPETGNYDTEDLTHEKWLSTIVELYEEIDTQLKQEDQAAVDDFVNILENGGDFEQATVLYNGYQISVSAILNALGTKINPESETYDISHYTKEQIIDAIYRVRESISSEENGSDAEEFSKFLEIINTPEDAQNANIIYGVIQIPIPLLVSKLGLEKDPETGNYDTEGLTQEKWVLAIAEMYEELETKLTQEDQAALDEFEHIVENGGDLQQTTILYNGSHISVSDILHVLGAVIDPTEGKYNISMYPDDEKRNAIHRVYLKMLYSPSSEGDDTDAKEFATFLEIINNPEYVEKAGVIYGGKYILIKLLLDKLGLEKDPNTGYYKTEGLTEEEWLATIVELYKGIVAHTTTTEMSTVPISEEDKEAVYNVLDAIKNMDDVQNATVYYKEFDVPIIRILNWLGAHIDDDTEKYDVSDYTNKEISDAIQIVYYDMQPRAADGDVITFDRFLKIMADTTPVQQADIIYSRTPIPMYLLVDRLQLEEDSETGRYNTEDLTKEKWLATIVELREELVANMTTTELSTMSLSDEDKEAVYSVLDTLKNMDDVQNATVHYKELDVPVILILHSLGAEINDDTEQYDVSEFTNNEILNAIQTVYFELQQPTTTVEANVTDAITFEKFLDIIDDRDYVRHGKIVYGLVPIPIHLLVDKLDLEEDPRTGHYNTEELTEERWLATIVELHRELMGNISTSTSTTASSDEVVDMVRNIVLNSTAVDHATVPYKGFDIPIILVLNSLGASIDNETEEYGISRFTNEGISNAIEAVYLDMQQPTTMDGDIRNIMTFEKFLDVIDVPGYVEQGHILYGEADMSITLLVDRLQLKKDPETGHYDTEELTEEKWLAAIVELYKEHVVSSTSSSSTAALSQEDKEAVDDVRNIVVNHGYLEQNTVPYKGFDIPIMLIIHYLDADINNDTQGYEINQNTDEEILSAIKTVYLDIQQATTMERDVRTEQPTEIEGGVANSITEEPITMEDVTGGITEKPTTVEGDVTEVITEQPRTTEDVTVGITEQLTTENGGVTDAITEQPTEMEGGVANSITEQPTTMEDVVTESITKQPTAKDGDVTERITKQPTPIDGDVTEGIPNQPTAMEGDVTEGITEHPTSMEGDVTEGITKQHTVMERDITEGITKQHTVMEGDVTEGITKEPTAILGHVTEGMTKQPTEMEGDITEGITKQHTVMEGDVTERITKQPIAMEGDVTEGITKQSTAMERDFSESITKQPTVVEVDVTDFIIEQPTTVQENVTDITFDKFLEIINDPNKNDQEVKIYKEFTMRIGQLAVWLGLQRDPQTGSYDTEELTEKKWLLIMKHLREEWVGTAIGIKTTETTLGEEMTDTATRFFTTLGEENTKAVDDVRNIVAKHGDLEQATVPYNGFNVHVTLILNALGARVNPDTEEYEISHFSDDELLRAINTAYLRMQELTTMAPGGDMIVGITLQQFIMLLKNPDYVQNGDIIYNNVPIKISHILQGLNLEEDPATRRYRTDNLRIDEIYNVILKLYEMHMLGTSTPRPTTMFDISGEEIESLESALASLKEKGVSSQGVLVFRNVHVPLQFIVSVLSLQNISLQEATLEEFYKTIQLYVERSSSTASPDAEALPRGLTEDQFYTIQYILYYLRSKDVSSTTMLAFDGHEIPLRYVLDLLKLARTDVFSVTVKIMYNIITVYIDNLYNPSGHTDGLDARLSSQLQGIINFLKLYGPEASGQVMLNGHNISLHYIASVLQLQGISIDHATENDLWRILRLLLVLQSEDNVRNSKQMTLNFFLEILETSDDVDEESFSYNGRVVDVKKLIALLNLQKDSSGKYITEALTVDDFWSALQQYVSSEQPPTTEIPSNEDEFIYNSFINVLSQSSDVDSDVITVNGTRIPAAVLARALDLQIDSATGRYKPDGVSWEQLLKVIKLYISSGVRTSSITVTRIVEQQREQIYQQFLNLIADPSKVPYTSLVVNDNEVPLKNMIAAMGLTTDSKTGKYDTSQLTKDQVWKVLMQYVTIVKQ